MLSTIGRLAVRRVVAGRPQSINRAFYSIWQSQRATLSKDGDSPIAYLRAFATASQAATKPKAKSTTTAKAKSSAKPRAKKTTTTKSTKAAAKKPKKKAVKKPAAKKKPGPKPKAKTEEEKERLAKKTLKAKALLTLPFKYKARNAWSVYVQEQMPKYKDLPTLTEKVAMIKKSYAQISPAELEALNHTTRQNLIDNEAKHKEWVESHTPDAISQANNARKLLTSKYKTKKYQRIQDSRLPKMSARAMGFFVRDRFATGDMKNIAAPEAMKLIVREWAALSPSERKPYEDREAEDKLRYEQEKKTVFQAKSPRLA